MSQTLRYFGTDGVRGRAFEGPLSLDSVSRWGSAWASVAQTQGVERLLIGWDPRCSSEPLVKAFLAGWQRRIPAQLLGVVPTPAVAWLTQRHGRAWGLMVSASHNPPEDNGLKGFDQRGNKLPEAEEFALERAFDAVGSHIPDPTLPPLDTEAMALYLDHLGRLSVPDELRVVVDCAHGATAPWAERLLGDAVVQWLGCPADGHRINVGVGSTHLDALQGAVQAQGACLGLAFDGDGDRCLMVAPDGTVVDGDQLLWLLAGHARRQGRAVPGVVGTVMTNGGLESALRHAGIPFVRTDVGDKFMVRELAQRGWTLAAEASGHVIQTELGPSGDALATALAALRALAELPAPARWNWRFTPWPQRLVNVVAQERRPLEALPLLQDTWRSLEQGECRIVIRWSGTEPKLRLMAEAPTKAQVDEVLHRLEMAARADLGL